MPVGHCEWSSAPTRGRDKCDAYRAAKDRGQVQRPVDTLSINQEECSQPSQAKQLSKWNGTETRQFRDRVQQKCFTMRLNRQTNLANGLANYTDFGIDIREVRTSNISCCNFHQPLTCHRRSGGKPYSASIEAPLLIIQIVLASLDINFVSRRITEVKQVTRSAQHLRRLLTKDKEPRQILSAKTHSLSTLMAVKTLLWMV